MPYYLKRFTDDVALEQRILRHTLYRDGFLFEEAELLLRQELPDRPVTASRGARRRRATRSATASSTISFRFLDPARSRLRSRAQAETYLREVVLPQLDHFVSASAWEEIAQAFVREQEDGATVGRWWGKVPTARVAARAHRRSTWSRSATTT